VKYRVIIEASAEAQLDEAYLYIRAETPQAATRWQMGLLDAAETLEQFPGRCPLAPEASAFGREIRHLIHGSYRLLFEIRGEVVYILHIRHGARRPLEPDEL